MSTPTTKTELLKTQAHELVKQFIDYDGSDRPEFIYTASTDAADGDPCTVTQYTYIGSTSRVEKRKESYDEWDSSWDI